MLFQNVSLVLLNRVWERAQLRVSPHGTIQELSSTDTSLRPLRGESLIDGCGGYLAPGFIDLHVHGALRRDTMEADPAAFDAIRRFHASGGTTALCLTSVSAPQTDILRLLDAAKNYLDKLNKSDAPNESDKSNNPDKSNAPNKPTSVPQDAAASSGEAGARVLGVHLEGPYFSPAKAGAHRSEFIRAPQTSETQEWLAFADLITQVTLAPELPGAPALIAELTRRGIIAGGGHSDAWAEQARAGFDNGMRHVTHVFNAMSAARRQGPYREAGLLEYALSEPAIRCELIADGHHVSPTLMRMLYQAKGAAGICLITDAGPGAGLPEGAAYRLGELDCVVRDGAGLTADGSALAGSTSRMIDGVRNLVRLAGVPLSEAVRMATWNPARALALDRRRGWHPLWGSLAIGAPADLALLTPELEAAATYVGGRCVWRKADGAGK